jgi:hypothetical protein
VASPISAQQHVGLSQNSTVLGLLDATAVSKVQEDKGSRQAECQYQTYSTNHVSLCIHTMAQWESLKVTKEKHNSTRTARGRIAPFPSPAPKLGVPTAHAQQAASQSCSPRGHEGCAKGHSAHLAHRNQRGRQLPPQAWRMLDCGLHGTAQRRP